MVSLSTPPRAGSGRSHRDRCAVAAAMAMSGCMAVAPETLLAELRVVSLRSDPPIYDATRGVTLTATVYAPSPARALVWTCTPGPLGCFEAGFENSERPLSSFATTGPLLDEELGHVVPAAPFALPPDQAPPTFAWALACEEGACPLLDAIAADPEPGSAAWQDALSGLADPFSLAAELPLQGTSLATRTLVSGLLGDAPAPTNPAVTLLAPEGELAVASGGSLELRFGVAHGAPVTVYPAATAGGFAAVATEVEAGEAVVTLVAGNPESEDSPPVPPGTEARLYVAFESEDGGAALWRGTARVE